MTSLRFPRETIPAFVAVAVGGIGIGLTSMFFIPVIYGNQKRYHHHNMHWQFYLNELGNRLAFEETKKE